MGLGLCIVGGTNRSEGPHVYIDDIIEGGDAHKVSVKYTELVKFACWNFIGAQFS